MAVMIVVMMAGVVTIGDNGDGDDALTLQAAATNHGADDF